MRWGILGTLLVVDDTGAEISLPAGRLRVLLAALLARANQVVSIDELCEILWDGRPPAGAARTVRVYLVRLRQALGARAAERIVTRAPGYVCQVSVDECDLLLFENLCQQARSAGSEQDAAELLAEALGLWRGTPLADVASDSLRARELPRLEPLRLQAVEDHLDAELGLGRHQQVIPRLEDLVSQYPLREHLHAALVRALAASGRRAEALAAYQRARRILVDQLGIEPGAELREWHERVLSGEVRSVENGTATPRQLPAGVRRFTGRQTELDALTRLVDQAGAAGGTVVISAIDGMAGIGKTALAVHAAHRLAEKFSGGQLFVDLHGYTQGHAPREAGEALDAFLRALGVSAREVPQDLEERAALYRQRLAGSRTLIVLDNAASEAQVRPLLPGNADCLVLITSRRRLKGLDDAHTLPLDVLPPADAIALLRSVAGSARVAADDPALAEIAELCGRLPLALRIAAALLRHRPAWPLTHLAALLRDQRHRVLTLSDGERDLGAVFDLSYAALDAGDQRLFRQLGLVPGADVDAYAVAALADLAVARATQRLEGLVDQNLLISPAPGRYRFHDLLRLHARELAEHDPEADRRAAGDRLLDYYQHTANHADTIIGNYPAHPTTAPAPAHRPELATPDAAWAWLLAERPNLLAALRDTLEHGELRRLIELTTGLATLLRADGPWDDGLAIHAVAADAARELGDRLSLAHTMIRLGDLRRLTGDLALAARDVRESLELFRATDDPGGQARALTRLAEIRGLGGDFDAAAENLAEALSLCQRTGERHDEARVRIRLAEILFIIGDFPVVMSQLQAALDIYAELPEPREQAAAFDVLGEVRRVSGDLPGAATALREALALYRSIGERRGQSRALAKLGEMLRLSGDVPGALRHLEESLTRFRALGDQLGQGEALGFLGPVRQLAGDPAGARRDLRECVALFRRLGAPSNLAWSLNRYAAVLAEDDDVPGALTSLHEAMELARQTHLPDEEANALAGFGECEVRSGDRDQGIAKLGQALEIFQRLGMRLDIDRVQARIAELER